MWGQPGELAAFRGDARVDWKAKGALRAGRGAGLARESKEFDRWLPHPIVSRPTVPRE